MMDVVVRPFAPADAGQVSDVMFRSFRTYLGERMKHPDGEQYWIDALSPKDGNIVHRGAVAEVQGRIVGCVEYTLLADYGLGILDRIGVDPDVAGGGIGRRLFAAAMEFWKASGARKVYTDVSSINPGALAFYKKMGFSVEGMLKDHFYPGVDEYQISMFL
ncbi:MAG: GNAT family N-acetyltransferase [Victivallaceae bacterium]|nr:GNAT family N-acetyltransferase [Victivallaceae bacterium]